MKKLKAAAAFLCIAAIGLLGEVQYTGTQKLSVASAPQQNLQMLQIENPEDNADTASTAVTTETTPAVRTTVTLAETEVIATMGQTTTEFRGTASTTGKDAAASTAATTVTETTPVTTSETAPETSALTESAAEDSQTYETEPVWETPSQEAQPVSGGYAVSVTPREYMMLVNVVSHEYGAEWVPTAEKALVAEVIMNRVNSPQFPNTVYEVLTQPGQFTGIEYYIELETYSHLVTDDVIAAVDLYLSHPEQFQHGYLFFNGDGQWNYFRCQY